MPTGSHHAVFLSQLLQILDVLIPRDGLLAVPPVHLLEVVLQLVYLVVVEVCLLLVAVRLLIDVADELVNLLYDLLLYTPTPESEVLLY